MRRLWPLTVRGTGALGLALASFIIANEAGIVELLYFGVLLVALIVAAVAALYLARPTDAVVRSLHPDISTVGRETLVDVRVAVRSAFPTPSGSWTDGLPKALRGRAQGAFPALGSGLRGGARAGEGLAARSR